MWRRCTPKNGFNFNQSTTLRQSSPHTCRIPPTKHFTIFFVFAPPQPPPHPLPVVLADGKRRQSQLFMRARVVAQGVTVAAMMGCLAWQGAQKDEKAASAAAASKITE